MIENIVTVAIIVVVLGLAGLYVYKAKKSGKKCIGCPASGSCGAKGSCSCSCGNSKEK